MVRRLETKDFFLFSTNAARSLETHVWNALVSLSVECKLKTWQSEAKERKKSNSRLSGALSRSSTTITTATPVKLFFFRSLCFSRFPPRALFQKKWWKTTKKIGARSEVTIARAFRRVSSIDCAFLDWFARDARLKPSRKSRRIDHVTQRLTGTQRARFRKERFKVRCIFSKQFSGARQQFVSRLLCNRLDKCREKSFVQARSSLIVSVPAHFSHQLISYSQSLKSLMSKNFDSFGIWVSIDFLKPPRLTSSLYLSLFLLSHRTPVRQMTMIAITNRSIFVSVFYKWAPSVCQLASPARKYTNPHLLNSSRKSLSLYDCRQASSSARANEESLSLHINPLLSLLQRKDCLSRCQWANVRLSASRFKEQWKWVCRL